MLSTSLRLAPTVARPTVALAAAGSIASRSLATSAAPIVVTDDEVDPRVKVITLSDPDRLNAMTAAMGDAVADAVSSIKADPEARAVVFTGAGRAFSAGGDLEFLDDRAADSPENNVTAMMAFYYRFLSIRTLRVPTVAAINGHAVGAGLCFAMASDIRVAQRGARLGVNFVKIGIHPGMAATHILPETIGHQAAARMILTGALFPADEAHAMGVVSEVVDEPDTALDRGLGIARSIAASSPIAVRLATETLRNRIDTGLHAALMREADAQAHCYAAPDLKTALAAIRSKTTAKF